MRLARLRRISQILFLALFLLVLAGGGIRVRLLLQADPLAAVLDALSTGALYRGLLWSLVILVPTFFLGRFFCGWMCPLGTLHHWVARWKPRRMNRYRKWQRWKYYVLIAVLAAAVLGSAAGGWLDPITLLARSLAASVLPAINYALDAVLEPLARSNWIAARYAAAGGTVLVRNTLLAFRQPYFSQGVLLGLILIMILALNLHVTRLWCRAVCPLGALLGACSRWALPRLEKRTAECKDCNRCLLDCQGGDDPIPGASWRKSECHLCMNCVADCPHGSLAFRWGAPGARDAPDIPKRKALGALAAGVAVVPLMRSAAAREERRIRPPGALQEHDFLARCIRCGACMKVCPNNALQPAFSEAGVEGLWTPVLAARTGYCEPSCTLCGDVCPTGAIWTFTLQQKGWIGGSAQPIRIGTAFYDRGRCLPWAMSTECIVCEEWCPVTPKAVILRTVETPNGTLRRPYIDAQRCVGCGACEYACPVKDRPAVYVTAIGESRARNRHFLLQQAAKTGTAFPDVPGWTRTGASRVFTPATLAQYIDGDAERFLQAGVERTLVQEYRYGGRSDVAASVYVMAAPGGARRIFESEQIGGSKPLAIGDAARDYGLSVTVLQGRRFIRLVAYDEAPLAELARALARM